MMTLRTVGQVWAAHAILPLVVEKVVNRNMRCLLLQTDRRASLFPSTRRVPRATGATARRLTAGRWARRGPRGAPGAASRCTAYAVWPAAVVTTSTAAGTPSKVREIGDDLAGGLPRGWPVTADRHERRPVLGADGADGRRLRGIRPHGLPGRTSSRAAWACRPSARVGRVGVQHPTGPAAEAGCDACAEDWRPRLPAGGVGRAAARRAALGLSSGTVLAGAGGQAPAAEEGGAEVARCRCR